MTAVDLTVTQPATVTLSSLAAPGRWVSAANCRTVPRHIFFPVRGEAIEPARQICARCPVLAECRDYALAAPVALQGVWGGLSAKERRNLRRRPTGLAVEDVA